MTKWWEGPLVGFDWETTAADPLVARGVTATVVVDEPGKQPKSQDWLVAVDEPIPAEATAIHKVTTERSQAEGESLAKVVTEITGLLVAVWEDQIPVVAYNAPFDFTVLTEERRRCGLRAMTLDGRSTPILDPLILDRTKDKYRRGSRKLIDVCRHYGVRLDAESAHTSAADALAAVGVARCLGKRFQLGGSMPQLFNDQRTWYSLWAANFEIYLRQKARRDGASEQDLEQLVVDRQWPVRVVTDSDELPF